MISYGFDFGTTNSLVAIAGISHAETLPIENDSKHILRSTIFMHSSGKTLVGQDAINGYLADVARGEPLRIITKETGKYIKVGKYSASGYQGEELVPEVVEVEAGDRGRLLQGLKSVLANTSFKGTEVFGKVYMFEDLLEIILSEMKRRADLVVGDTPTSVVFGRPVKYVGGDESLALDRITTVAKRVGFKKIEFEMEPIAAALSYGIEPSINHKLLVFDFGGGTLDVSITEHSTGEVLSISGAPIGGDLLNSTIFEQKLYKYFGKTAKLGPQKLPMPYVISESLKDWHSISHLKTKSFMHSMENIYTLADDKSQIDALKDLVIYNLGFLLYESIDQAKIGLSRNACQPLVFNQQSISIDEKITREEFQEIIMKYMTTIKTTVNEALSNADLRSDQIDVVLTTGGSSLIPTVREMLFSMFGREKVKEIDVFSSVAKGLAIKAHQVFG